MNLEDNSEITALLKKIYRAEGGPYTNQISVGESIYDHCSGHLVALMSDLNYTQIRTQSLCCFLILSNKGWKTTCKNLESSAT